MDALQSAKDARFMANVAIGSFFARISYACEIAQITFAGECWPGPRRLGGKVGRSDVLVRENITADAH